MPVLKGRVTNAPPAVAGLRVSVTEGREKSREMAGKAAMDVSADENDVPVAEPDEEKEEPELKLKL